MTRAWSNLSLDILRLIVGKVKTLEDFTRICAVCSNWGSGLEWSDFDRPQLPWLMLPCPHKSGVDWGQPCQYQCRCRCSFSYVENKVHHLDFPEAYGKKCVGSSYGWMVMVEDVSPAIFMLNPLTKQRIELPPITTMPDILGFEKEEVGREYIFRCTARDQITFHRFSLKDIEDFFVFKVILSNDPTKEEDCVAVAIYGEFRQLVFCKLGDNNWTPVQSFGIPQHDVVYFKGKFYVINGRGKVGVFDVRNPQVTVIHEAPSGTNSIRKMYLAVDTTGALLHISRLLNEYYNFSDAERDDANDDDDANDNVNHLDGHHEENEDEHHRIKDFYRTGDFNVFKLDEEKKVWIKLRDVGDNIIFLGDNKSICYSAIEHPECNGNSIYFTDNYWESRSYAGHDIGIFDIGKGCVITRKVPCLKGNLSSIFPRPVWFTPSLGRVTLG